MPHGFSDVRLRDSRKRLFEAFQSDHADLREGLQSLRTALAEDEFETARGLASALLTASGAHIAFEEHDFYPALRAWLTEEEVGAMYREHAEGRRLLESIAQASDTELSDDSNLDLVLLGIEDLERHVAGCGDLFEAMGGLDERQSAVLLKRLQAWRNLAPGWAEAGSAHIPV